MIEKNETLNIEDLDVQELENRLEMTMVEADMEAAGWIHVVTKPCQPGTGPGSGLPGQPDKPCVEVTE